MGSAANANVALIVGYVGASHISAESQDAHAASLINCSKSDNGIGADIIIRDMEDLPTIVNYFLDLTMDDPSKVSREHFDFSELESKLRDKCWLRDGKNMKDDGSGGGGGGGAATAAARSQQRPPAGRIDAANNAAAVQGPGGINGKNAGGVSRMTGLTTGLNGGIAPAR